MGMAVQDFVHFGLALNLHLSN
jgi:uncharacterized protein YjbJ (UPF0337 family)